MSEKIIIVSDLPGPRPRKPPRPRRPRETFWRTESVWTSEDDDILLADLLHLIPSNVKAHRIRISVEKNQTNGYPHVVISYNHEIQNTRFAEQLADYNERIKRYAADLSRWQARDAIWAAKVKTYEDSLLDFKGLLKKIFDDHLEDAI